MKRYIFTLFLGGIMGAYFHARFSPQPEPQVVKQVEVKTRTIRVIEPSGKVIETVEVESKDKPISKPKPSYGVGLYHDKTLFGEIRLGQLPFFVIAESDFKQSRIGIKLEF